MKRLFTILLILSIQWAIAQIPTGYYSTATGTGYTLKTQLHNIISVNNIVPNSTGYSNLWGLYATQIRDNFSEYENDGSLFDIYSENPYGADPYNFTSTDQQDTGSNCPEGGCYNREHLVPQSIFDDYQLYPMRNDAHHVVPTDKTVNAARSDHPFGKVSVASYTSQNGSKVGNNLNSGYSSGYTGTVFEPLDDFKGDVARSIFYFVTCYEDLMDNFYGTTTSESKVMFDGSNNKAISSTFLNILLTWNSMDPVSQKEITFNNRIYDYQGNRNPFIDHPEWVTSIWGSPAAVNEMDNISLLVYPNPVSDKLFIEYDDTVKINEYHIVSIIGKLVQKGELTDNQIDVQNIPNGIYFITFYSENAYKTQKLVVEKR